MHIRIHPAGSNPVNVRLVIAAVLTAVVGTAVAPALASSASPDRRQIDVCLFGPTPQAPNQEGICVGVPDPRR